MMRSYRNKKAFTLIEMLIVLVLVGILSTLLFQTYTTITQIALKIENEKTMQTETLFALQTIQNLADRNSIDYEYYITSSSKNTLIDTKGRTTILALSGQDGKTRISNTGECMSTIWWTGSRQPNCGLMLRKNNEELLLIDPDRITISDLMFRITPTVPIQQLYTNQEISLSDISSPGFWMFVQFRHPQYRPLRTYNISLFVQQFFSLPSWSF